MHMDGIWVFYSLVYGNENDDNLFISAQTANHQQTRQMCVTAVCKSVDVLLTAMYSTCYCVYIVPSRTNITVAYQNPKIRTTVLLTVCEVKYPVQ